MERESKGVIFINRTVIIMFRSRNKDNRGIPGFHERTKVFLTDKKVFEHCEQFKDFIKKGVTGEMSRMYVSVNARDLEKTKKALICRMLMDDRFDLKNINAATVSVAMQKENAAEKRWMFDYDGPKEKIEEFVEDVIREIGNEPVVCETPHGYAVVVERGFDTRHLMEKWGDMVELKRDDFLCYDWGKKGECIS